MSASTIVSEQTFVLEAEGLSRMPFPIDTGRGTDCTVQVTLTEGGWGTGKLAVLQSNDGMNFEAQASVIEFTADGFKDFSVLKIRYIDVRETADLDSGSRVIVSIIVRGESA